MAGNHRTPRRDGGMSRLLRWLGAAALLLGAVAARADAFADAAAGHTLFVNNGCSGCHDDPVWLRDSSDPDLARRNLQSLKTLIGNVPSDPAAFKSLLDGTGVSAMVTWADSPTTTTAQLTQMAAFLIGSRDAVVTSSVSFPQTGINPVTSASQTVTIQNLRYYAISYSAPILSNVTDYSIGTESCGGGRSVAANGGTCTIQILFNPKSGGSKPATLSFSLTGDSLETPLAARTGASAITISGFGVQAPVATITSAIASPQATGSTINLAGTGTDNNGLALTAYTWTVHKPDGSSQTLSGASPSFTATIAGHYSVDFSVSDSLSSSATVTAVFDVIDRPVPVLAAVALPAYLAHTITLNGSGSHAYAGDTFTTSWSITARPAGSAATLVVAGPSDTHPTLVPDAAGTWTISLDVVDQGIHAATPATATFTVSNPPAPVANAGTYSTVLVNSTVTLDGTGSHSQIGDALTYQWSVQRHSDHAVVAVTNATSATASFTPTTADTYDVTLQVADGPTTATATASIQASNGEITVAPIADQTSILGVTVALAGSATSAVDPSLTYAWSITSAPSGSTATFVNPASATTSITPDVTGVYIVKLTASDHFGHSASASARITVQPPLSASTSSLNFAAAVGSSATASAVLTNNQASALTLQTITFGDAAASDFALDSSSGCQAGGAIAPAAPCTLVVRFTPTVVGARNASVSLGYAGAGSPVKITLLGTASPRPQGVLASTSWSQTFDDTVLGNTNTKTITLSNTSSGASAAPVVFASLALSGAAASDYQLGGTCSVAAPLAPQASCTLVFTFAPSAIGARAASLQITSNASNPLVSITLTGNGLPVPAPLLSLAPAVVNFGQQTVGGAYPPQTATLTNSGTAPLVISTLTISGAGFSIADASGCTGVTLAIGASCQVSVAFSPAAVQAGVTGSLTINSNVAGSPTSLGLIGSGTAFAAPVLSWSPAVATLDFGTVQAGTVSTTQSVVLSNQGPGGATLKFINAIGADSPAFSISAGTCPVNQPLFAGSSCRLDIAFVPSAAGARTATLQVVSNGSAPAPVTLKGTALGSPTLALSVSASTLDFGSVQLGTRSVPQTVRLSNSGSGIVQVASISASGVFSVQGASCPSAPFALQSGAECTISVSFSPTGAGPSTGTLSVHSDAQAQPGDIALSGHADEAPDLSNGGCSLSRGDGPFDPTLWTLAALAALALAYRRGERRRDVSRRGR